MQGRIPGLGAIVLCGGGSRRMGASKAELPFGDEPMLTRVARILAEVAEPVVVVAAPGQPLPAIPAPCELLRDEQRGRGPLEGLRVGLRSLRGRVWAAYATGCDFPLLRRSWVEGLAAWARSLPQQPATGHSPGPSPPGLTGWQIAIPQDDQFHHWLAGLYRPEVLPVIEELLASGSNRTGALMGHAAVATVSVELLRRFDPGLDSLKNVNDLQAYLAALARCGLQPEVNRLPCRELGDDRR